MPILSAEPNIYPLNLLENIEFCHPTEEQQATWWVFYTRPRQEKSLARDLLHLQIPFYLPLVSRRLLIRSRPIRTYVPLFAGYVFAYGSDANRVRALSTRRVAQVYGCPDSLELQNDLRNIQRLIESNRPLTVESRLQPGDRVRIRSGPFADLDGTICRRKNQTRLVVWVNLLQQGVSLEIDDCWLEPVD